MGDDDRVEILGFLADFGEAAREFAHAQARVDQDPGLRGREKRRSSPRCRSPVRKI